MFDYTEVSSETSKTKLSIAFVQSEQPLIKGFLPEKMLISTPQEVQTRNLFAWKEGRFILHEMVYKRRFI